MLFWLIISRTIAKLLGVLEPHPMAAAAIRKYYAQFGDRLPAALNANLANLESRLHGYSSHTPTQNQNLVSWVESLAGLCCPDEVHWCTGTIQGG